MKSPSAVERALYARIEALFTEHVDAVFNVAFRVLWNQADAEDAAEGDKRRMDRIKATERVKAVVVHRSQRESKCLTGKKQRRPPKPSS